jgi:hypothetical protein
MSRVWQLLQSDDIGATYSLLSLSPEAGERAFIDSPLRKSP